ncbi:cation:proton antiporter [Nocardia aobensis]|uniref:Cation:proton antiporter n=1 Tax=Nocardia aobensis TaxID=257277 RepID=A0ABW6PDU9_9NOCA
MSSGQLVIIFIDLVVIMAAARALGWLACRLGQPAVIGEIGAGVLAGPTVLGHSLSGLIFPHEARPYLSLLAQVGVATFMFLAGMELDRSVFSSRRRLISAMSIAAYIGPFVLGCGVAALSLSRHQTADRVPYIVFVACALAVTAFPVLARVLQDRHLMHTEVGKLSLASAAIVDIFAWSVLAAALMSAGSSTGRAWRWVVLIPMAGVMWWLVRPVLVWLGSRATGQTMVVIAVAGTLLFGAATEWIGLHMIFGAFAFGLVFPRERRLIVEPGARVVSAILLPGFFVVAGLSVDLRALDTTAIGELAVIVIAAILGKVGSVYLVGRIMGLESRSALAVASLLNTRGLTELVILDIGLTTGLINGALYSMLVVMALVTTAMTAPLLMWSGMASGDPPRIATGLQNRHRDAENVACLAEEASVGGK